MKNMLFSVMMSEGASLQEHLLKIKDVWEQLETTGQKMEEKDMVVITLKRLPRAYEHFIETLNIQMLTSSLESCAISSYNRTEGRNNLVVVKARVLHRHLLPMSRENANGLRRNIMAIERMHPKAQRPSLVTTVARKDT